MKFAEFAELTGWNTATTARMCRRGYLSSGRHSGSGNHREYTTMDVAVAAIIEDTRARFNSETSWAALDVIVPAVRSNPNVFVLVSGTTTGICGSASEAVAAVNAAATIFDVARILEEAERVVRG